VDLRTIQDSLRMLGYDPGPSDGLEGPRTTGAVRQFQADHAPPLRVDGLAGVATQAELRRALKLYDAGPVPFKISYELAVRIFPHCRRDAAAAFDAIPDEVVLAGIDRPLRAAHFLAQVSAETGQLSTLEESFRYSAARLYAVFPRYVHSIIDAEGLIAQGPEAIANRVYGSRLGNALPNDGWTFRGGGFLDTTGRDNYRAIAHENDPAVVRTPLPGLRAALNFWQMHGCSHIADGDDATALRRVINGGTNGMATVFSELARIKALL
jgi:predicted chitinase